MTFGHDPATPQTFHFHDPSNVELAMASAKKSVLFQTIAAIMDKAKRPYESIAEDGLMIVRIDGGVGNWRAFIHVTDDDETHRIVIYSHLPLRTSGCSCLRVTELLTRINNELSIGHFELNLSDGHALFRTALNIIDGQLPQPMFERLYELNQQAMNLFYEAVLASQIDCKAATSCA